jgi:hypothetical protein
MAGGDACEAVHGGEANGASSDGPNLVTEIADIGTENAGPFGHFGTDEVVDLTTGEGDGGIGGHGVSF